MTGSASRPTRLSLPEPVPFDLAPGLRRADHRREPLPPPDRRLRLALGRPGRAQPRPEQFVSNTDRMLGALGSENQNLASAIGELPSFMRNFNTTAVNLRATLDDLDPLVNAPSRSPRSCRPSPGAARLCHRRRADGHPPRRHRPPPRPQQRPDRADRAAAAPGEDRRRPGHANGKTRPGALPVSRQALAAACRSSRSSAPT